MASVINTNSLSLLTQNNLNKSQASLNTAIQRLSSGLRINSAKDDAAGQAIANRFTANIKGLTQAQRNANDGISMAQTTEGALSEINTNLQRIRELTVQANNATNSDADKTSIQAEIEQRMAEIARTSEQTDFNGTKVLNANQTLKIQVGAKDGETIDIALKKMGLSELGLTGFNIDGSGSANEAATKDDLVLNGFAAGAVVNGTTTYSKTTPGVVSNNAVATRADVFAAATNGDTVLSNGVTYTKGASGFTSSVTGEAQAAVQTALTPTAGSETTATIRIGTTDQEVKIDSAGKIFAADDHSELYLDTTGNLTKNSAGAPPAATLTNVLANMTLAGTGTGGTITVNSGDDSTVFTAVAGTATLTRDETLSAATMQSRSAAGAAQVTIGGTAYDIAADGTVETGGADVYLEAGALSTNATTTAAPTTETFYVHANGNVMDGSGNRVYEDSAAPGTFTLNERSGDTSTANPLAVLDEALSRVDQLRSDLGAVQNRFDSVISNLGTTITNLSSSRSRIEDADYATEVSNMTRANILQQAGTSVLAQANQTTQGVLSLLR